MTKLLALAMTAATLVGGCAVAERLFDPSGSSLVDEYAAVRVRVYRSGPRCRVEVILPTETLHTAVTRCTAIPRRQVSP
jgi:hypothetical protein